MQQQGQGKVEVILISCYPKLNNTNNKEKVWLRIWKYR